MDLIVDNSAGGDGQFADEVAVGLRGAGMSVRVREPSRDAMFDTGVHLVTAGLVLRVPAAPSPEQRALIEQVVRAALMHRPSLRRRTRSVPVHLGETPRVLAWIDVVE